ncbi:hypothetical protein CS022_19710 [Veronia nyctiphanis]|uniref:Lipoprotein n=1 Tax=Veronia nyctiphanis TaxID=1278244 RepID=A0A4Q0YMX3_9GAMM|nr:hypothetical protein [Veronia nyctiphanis]RXJ71793.1 hypothetical protein CS022_19710 [Veronia nyctiphanis]
MPKLPVFLICFSLFLSGCVPIPTSRTYLAPNPDDGILTTSQGCGYQRTGKDALSRETDDYYLKIKPSDDGTHSYVGIYIQTESDGIEFDPNKVKILGDGIAMTTSKVTVDKRPPRKGSEYISFFINIFYPEDFDTLNSLEVKLGDAMTLNGAPVKQAPLRFNRATVSDVFLASINC